MLEETPDFLQETPEHDRLWFEQKPPRDFDFDRVSRAPATRCWTSSPTGRWPATGSRSSTTPTRSPTRRCTRFARETRLSETSFVQTADRAGADYRNRIFMMSGEIPFAGHPSLGTAVAVARARGEPRAHATSSRPQPGVQPIDVELDGDARARLDAAGAAEFGAGARPRRRARRASASTAGDADPTLPLPGRLAPASPQVIAPRARRRRARAACGPTTTASARLLAEHGAIVLYLAAVDPEARHAPRARSFVARAPRWARTRRPARRPARCAPTSPRARASSALEIDQGVEMGRPQPAASRRSRATACASAATSWSWPRGPSTFWTPDRFRCIKGCWAGAPAADQDDQAARATSGRERTRRPAASTLPDEAPCRTTIREWYPSCPGASLRSGRLSGR